MALSPPIGLSSGQKSRQKARDLFEKVGSTEESDLDSAGIDKGPGAVSQAGSGESRASLVEPSGPAPIINRPIEGRVLAPVGVDEDRRPGGGPRSRPEATEQGIQEGLKALPELDMELTPEGLPVGDTREALQGEGVIPEGRPALQSEIDAVENISMRPYKQEDLRNQRREQWREEQGLSDPLEDINTELFVDEAYDTGQRGDAATEGGPSEPIQWVGRGGWQYRFNPNIGEETGPTITATDPNREGAVFTIGVDEQAPAGGRYAGQNMWQRIWAERAAMDAGNITEGMGLSAYENAMRKTMESRGQEYIPMSARRASVSNAERAPVSNAEQMSESEAARIRAELEAEFAAQVSEEGREIPVSANEQNLAGVQTVERPDGTLESINVEEDRLEPSSPPSGEPYGSRPPTGYRAYATSPTEMRPIVEASSEIGEQPLDPGVVSGLLQISIDEASPPGRISPAFADMSMNQLDALRDYIREYPPTGSDNRSQRAMIRRIGQRMAELEAAQDLDPQLDAGPLRESAY